MSVTSVGQNLEDTVIDGEGSIHCLGHPNLDDVLEEKIGALDGAFVGENKTDGTLGPRTQALAAGCR
jgi:hypothetical protein